MLSFAGSIRKGTLTLTATGRVDTDAVIEWLRERGYWAVNTEYNRHTNKTTISASKWKGLPNYVIV